MDYNYVRMRNAIKENDSDKAEYYRKLYETGAVKTRSLTGIDFVIVIMLVVSVLLGIYILYSETKQIELRPSQSQVTTEPLPVVGEVQ